MREWFNRQSWKDCVSEMVPRVRIPLSPPENFMKNITFITGNQNKADRMSESLGIELAHQKIDLDEIQSLDTKKIVEHKVKQAYDQLQSPVIVEDTWLQFEAMNGLPGPFIKFFLDNMPFQDICDLLNGKSRKARAGAVFGYYDGQVMKIMESGLDGTIAQHPAGDGGWGWDQFFIPDGYAITRAQMSEEDYQKTYLQIKPFADLKNFLSTIND